MKVLAAARRAFDTVPIYRRLYRDWPARTRAVPAIGPSAFHLADSVADCIVDADAVVAAVDPRCLILLTDDPRLDDLAAAGCAVLRLVGVDGWRRTDRRGARLLFSDELHAIGAARAGDPFTLLAQGGLVFETTDPGGQLLVTTVAFTCLPLIRYALGSAGDDLRQGRP